MFFVECPRVGSQGDSFFSNTCQKMRGGKHVKVKKQPLKDALHLTDFQVHRDLLDNLSVKAQACSVRYLKIISTFLKNF